MSSETPFDAAGPRGLRGGGRAADPAPARRRRVGGARTGTRSSCSGSRSGVSGPARRRGPRPRCCPPATPVPFVRRCADRRGRAQGAPIPGTVQAARRRRRGPGRRSAVGPALLGDETQYACVQVGRLWEGKLGQISAAARSSTSCASASPTVLSAAASCSTAAATRSPRSTAMRSAGAQPQPCPTGFHVGTDLRGPHGSTVRCTAPGEIYDRFRLARAERHELHLSRRRPRSGTARPLGGVGAFLVVQQHIKPVMREFGFHHKDPKLNLSGPAEPYLSLTPGSQVITRIAYTGGECVVRVTSAARGACNAQAGYVPIPQPEVEDVRAPLRVFLTPDKQAFRVRFPGASGRARRPQHVHDRGPSRRRPRLHHAQLFA